MMTMTYSCSCGWRSGLLNDAQDHANANGHVVSITGSITSNIPQVDATAIAEAARARATEAEIMRRARDRGLLGK